MFAQHDICAQAVQRIVKWYNPRTKAEKQSEYTLRNNLLDGYYQVYYRSGAVEARYETSRGKYHGRYQHYLPNGTLETTGYYSQGRKHGIWTTSYGSTGAVQKEVFDSGQPVSVHWYRHGRLEQALTYHPTPSHRTVKQYYYRPDASAFATQGEVASDNTQFRGSIGLKLGARVIDASGAVSGQYEPYPALCPAVVMQFVDPRVYRNVVLAALNYCQRHPEAPRPSRVLLYGAGDRTQGTFAQIEWVELWDDTRLIGRTYYRDWLSKMVWQDAYYTAFSNAE
ncbi:toxin-antitoxin system YwqK family antitoxin [Hymenobacter sp. CRA2]|uniref:toxin-antitoxin system YwqK family antitoxin n=1 Tax=Hymenobacter sp. CRA2 TaxID=1955620 RepID=UPI001C37599E|nr:hypothetical protein [Hymenobacter sp. CRA2]